MNLSISADLHDKHEQSTTQIHTDLHCVLDIDLCNSLLSFIEHSIASKRNEIFISSHKNMTQENPYQKTI